MDNTTELALGAIVRGLYRSEAITADQVLGVCAALRDAAGVAQERYGPQQATELLGLSHAIKVDTAVS